MSGTNGQDGSGGGAIATAAADRRSGGGGGSSATTATATATTRAALPVETRTVSTSPTNGTLAKKIEKIVPNNDGADNNAGGAGTATTAGDGDSRSSSSKGGESSKKGSRATDESCSTAAAAVTAAAATTHSAGQGGGQGGHSGGGPRRNRSGSHGHGHHHHHHGHGHGHRHGHKGHSHSHHHGGGRHHHHNNHHGGGGGGRKRTSSSGSAKSSQGPHHHHPSAAPAPAAVAATATPSPTSSLTKSTATSAAPTPTATSTAAATTATTINPDTRSWFLTNLATGADRCHASAITDPIFVSMFVDLASREVVGRGDAGADGGDNAVVTGVSTANANGEEDEEEGGVHAGGGAVRYSTEELTRLYDRYRGNDGRPVRSDNNDSASNKKKDEEAPVAEGQDGTAEDERFASDAFRIRPGQAGGGDGSGDGDAATAAAHDKTEDKTDNEIKKAEKEDGGNGGSNGSSSTSPRVTLHFNSGLSLPVITTTNTAATTRAVLAAAERTKQSPTSADDAEDKSNNKSAAAKAKAVAVAAVAAVADPPANADASSGGGDDVSSTPSFSALGSPLSKASAAATVVVSPPAKGGSCGSGNGSSGGSGGAAVIEGGGAPSLPSPTGEASNSISNNNSKSRRKKSKRQRQAANKISQAKRAAARALGKQAATTAEDVLMSHVRLVVPSSLGYVAAAASASASSSSMASGGGNDDTTATTTSSSIPGPILIIDPEFLGSPRMFLELASKVVQTASADGEFLSSSDWLERVAESAMMSAPVLLLAKMEQTIRAAHSAATLAGGLSTTAPSPDLSATKPADDSSGGLVATSTASPASSPGSRSASDYGKDIAIILSPSASPAVGTEVCLRQLLDLRQWIRSNESSEAVTMLTSKVHNMLLENQCIGPYEFRLEHLFATPLGLLPGVSQPTKDASVLDKWDNGTNTVLCTVKLELDAFHPIGGGKKSTGHGKGVNAMSVDEKAVETADGAAAGGASPSKSKKKKKKKKGKKKSATGTSAASAATGDAASLGSKSSVPTGKIRQVDATENAANAQNTLNAISQDNTRAKSTASQDSATSSAAARAATAVATGRSASLDDTPTIQQASSADFSRSSADSLPQEPVKVRPATRSASIRIDSGNNMVVGLGRMMEEEEHHDDGWETVPAKGSEKRTNNTRTTGNAPSRTDERQGGAGGGARSHQQQQLQQQQQPQSPGKKKKNRAREREKLRNKKFMKEVLSNILDGVEEEVEHRRQSAAIIANEEKKPPLDTKRPPSGAQSKAASLRDVVVGPTGGQQQQGFDRTSSMPNVVNGEDRGKKKTASKKPGGGAPSGRHAVAGIVPSGGIGTTDKASVDQKTAPTVPETVSARSSGVTGGRTTATDTAQATAAGPESSASIDGTAEPLKAMARTEQAPQDSSPPLPTLLGANNTISASSSVASSLEAPHATRHRPRGRSHELKEDDVGYHLVNLCDKLSDEMAVFMERRAMALRIRRNERAALLGALQESVTKLFSGHCRVEMYGSCATQLDLPSSDLDVVICGLGGPDQSHHGPSQQLGGKAPKDQAQKDKSKKSIDKDGAGSESKGLSEVDAQDDSSAQPHVARPQQQQEQQQGHQQYTPQYYQYYPPPSPNGARVLQLAAELEMQPWAVQVKAIPTATVPVIKLLADPSRAPGGGLDWMVQPQHMANVSMSAQEANMHHQEPPSRPHPQQPSALPQTPPGEVRDGPAPQSQPQQGYYSGPVPGTAQMPFIHPAAMPWRGADIMNGLISIDITFEGPEHGGIGSTIFSASFVQDVCNEAGLPPDATAAVQMIMVVKELLAQRRLNEPYSGGLSSFAVLLLAFSVIRERKLIQEEMQRIEKQRRAVEGSASVPKKMRGGRGKGKGKGNKDRPVRAENRPSEAASKIPPVERVESTRAEGPLSISSSSTPVATGQAKSQSKHTQTVEDSAAAPPALSDHVAKKAAAVPEPTEALVKGPNKAPFSFKDALQSAPKPKNAPAPAAAHPKKEESGPEPKSDSDSAPAPESAPAAASAPKSWAAIAKKKTQPSAVVPARTRPANGPKKEETQGQVPIQVAAPAEDDKKKMAINNDGKKKADAAEPTASTPPSSSSTARPDSAADEEADSDTAKPQAASTTSLASASASTPAPSALIGDSRSNLPFPEGSNDVLEVLCSGEPTAGKLLMHFLLFYGQHFESMATAVDVSSVHHPDFPRYRNRPYGSYLLSSFVPRHSGGSIDPVTGMYTVDPIVIYDPLEGCENNNVARSCFAWASIRSVFHQCYMTLSGAVERGSGTGDGGAGLGRRGTGGNKPRSSNESAKATQQGNWGQGPAGTSEESSQQQVESVLALLLSF